MTEFQLLPEEPLDHHTGHSPRHLGQKPPLKPKEVWAIRIRLQINHKPRDLVLFNLAIDTKLRSIGYGKSKRKDPSGFLVCAPISLMASLESLRRDGRVAGKRRICGL